MVFLICLFLLINELTALASLRAPNNPPIPIGPPSLIGKWISSTGIIRKGLEFDGDDFRFIHYGDLQGGNGKYRFSKDGRLFLQGFQQGWAVDFELTHDRLIIKNNKDLIFKLMDFDEYKRTGYVPGLLDFRRYDPRID